MENLISEGRLVTLECTAASNIAAGRMVAVNTGASMVYTFCNETVGLSGTAGAAGMRFIGILDDDVSANQCPITVWTEGVFELQLSSAITTAALIGRPVWGAISGTGNLVTTLAPNTGSYPVGSVVGLTNGTSGQTVNVKIKPGAFRWGSWNSVTGTEVGNHFPPTL